MSECAVAGCNLAATGIFEAAESPQQWGVCEAHLLELQVNPYTTSANGDLLVGAVAPLTLINYTITISVSPNPLVTMIFGRDGHEEHRVEFFMTPEDARDICGWVAGSDHPYRRTVE